MAGFRRTPLLCVFAPLRETPFTFLQPFTAAGVPHSNMKIPLLLPLLAALCFTTVSPAQDSEKPRAEAQEKMEMGKHRIEELRTSGQNEEAAKLEQRMREEMGRQGGQPDRMRHVMEAIKHLRAAGMNEAADRVEQMAREQQKSEGRGREQAGPREGMEQMQRAVREMQEQVQKAFKETHEQMAKMARTIDELREQIGKR